MCNSCNLSSCSLVYTVKTKTGQATSTGTCALVPPRKPTSLLFIVSTRLRARSHPQLHCFSIDGFSTLNARYLFTIGLVAHVSYQTDFPGESQKTSEPLLLLDSPGNDVMRPHMYANFLADKARLSTAPCVGAQSARDSV